MIDGLNVTVTVASLDGVVRLAVDGEIDVNTADRFERVLRDAVFEAGSTVALDLSLVPFMGSAGISALVRARNLAMERGIALQICKVSHPVERVLNLMGLMGLLDEFRDQSVE